MKIIFGLLVLVHGAIHLMGFFKAFGIATDALLLKSLSKPLGILWLAIALLFLTTGLLYLFREDLWAIFALAAVIFSQVLVVLAWGDAKFGTIPNVIILAMALIGLAGQRFEQSYHNMVQTAIITQGIDTDDEVLKVSEIQSLPQSVQRYLQYVGVIGKPKVKNFKIVFEGQMRNKGQDWFNFTSEQYNFIKDPTRLFFMKAKVKGVPTSGLHAYGNGKAAMQVKPLSLFPVVSHEGGDMVTTETVTYFNDICLFAPSALVDKRITWETINDLTAKAIFTTGTIQIEITLYFNETGQLTNFVSHDRTEISESKKLKFSTPVKHYKDFNGIKLPTYGEAIWHYEEGAFVYGRFFLKHIEYNVDEMTESN